MLNSVSTSVFADSVLNKLETITNASLKKENIELGLECLSAKSNILYLYNLKYKDELIEDQLVEFSKLTKKIKHHERNDKNILFYDGFGLSTRGLAYIYLKALNDLGYNIIYISPEKPKNEQIEIINLLKEKHKIYKLEKRLNLEYTIEKLDIIYEKEKFSKAFFYSKPDDVSGIVSFMHLEKLCTRYLINLTDHAFWAGVNCFDYCLEFREYGYQISRKYRKIPVNKLLILPYYPKENTADFKGFSFSEQNKKIIFSGGSIYKTIDRNDTFYKLIEDIVKNNDDVIFLYAGYGDTSRIDKLVEKYPNQVFYEHERDDFQEILKRSRIYLNTYPISGALMLQYAALNNCVPVTLKRFEDHDAEGILLNEDELCETFISKEKTIEEINRLLRDDDYLYEKKEILKKSVIKKEEFEVLLKSILDTNKGLKYIETFQIQNRLYTNRDAFTKYDVICSIVRIENIKLVLKFPKFIIYKIIMKVSKELNIC